MVARLPAWLVPLVIGFWIVIVTVLAVRAHKQVERSLRAQGASTNTVFPLFPEAGRKWVAGLDPYDASSAHAGAYRYSPTASVLFVPFGWFAPAWGGVVWVVINAAVFLVGLWYWLSGWYRGPNKLAWVALVALAATPLSVGSIANGQVNVLIIGLLMLAVALTRAQRWWWVSIVITLATVFKIYPLALGLVLVLVYPRQLSWRLALCVAGAVLLPYLAQTHEYVNSAYVTWYHVVRGDERTAHPLEFPYRDAAYLYRHYGSWLGNWLFPQMTTTTAEGIYRLVQLATAAGVAGVVIWVRWTKRQTAELPDLILALVVLWMMLFGPSTESATYSLLGPVAAWLLVRFGLRWPRREGAPLGWLVALGWLLLASAVVALWFPGGRNFTAIGIQPLAAVVLMPVVLVLLGRGRGNEYPV